MLQAVATVLCCLLLCTVFLFLLLTLYIVWIRRKYSHLPTPPLKSFYFGHVGYFEELRKTYGDNRPMNYVLMQLHELTGNAPVFVVFLFTYNLVVCMDPLGNKKVLSDPTKTPSLFKYLRYLVGERFLGNGLFSVLDTEEWKPRRKVYDQVFNRGYLKSLVPSFNERTNVFIDNLRLSADGVTPVAMKTEFSNFTCDVISQVAFSTDFSDWGKLNLKYNNSLTSLHSFVETVFEGLQNQMNDIFFPYHYLHPMKSRVYAEAIRALRSIGRDCIMKRVADIEEGKTVPNDILTCILKVGQSELGDMEILVDDFVTFFIAGQETTGNALAFAVIEILQNPHVLTKLINEIDEILGTKESVTPDDLDQLKYTEQIIKEVLRLHPPVGVTFKESPAEGILLCNHMIPGNTHISFPTNGYCRMNEHFDDPLEFDPDRFDSSKPQPSSFVYFPFGVGLRSCLGKHFAMMEAKLVLARLFQTFTLKLPSDYTLVDILKITTRPQDNVNITLLPRY